MDSLYRDLVQKISISPNRKTKQKNYLKRGALAIVDQGKELISGYTDDVSMCVPCNLPVIVFGDHTRAVKYVNFPFGAGADGIKILQPKPSVFPKYLYYATQYLVLRLENKGYARHYQHLEKKELNIPSFPEQEHIVARIESLFSRLGNGEEALEKAKEQLAVYRQAVLKGAFALGENSQTVEMCELVDEIRIGPFGTALHKGDYIESGIPVINPQHIKNSAVLPSSKVTISPKKAAELSAYRLQANDVIMGRRGEMGRVAAVTEKEDGWICGTGSLILRFKKDYDAGFYARVLSSPASVRYLEDHALGTTMKNLNENIVRHIAVPRVTRQMQGAIMAILDEKLSVCDSIEQTIDTALQQAEALRQSILKKAFEGEL